MITSSNEIAALAAKYPMFLNWNTTEDCLEMYLDHHMLSQFRLCQAKFVEEILNCQSLRGGRAWSLDFGLWVHDCLDSFYKSFKDTGNPPLIDTWTPEGLALWDYYHLEDYKADPLKKVSELKTDEKKYHNFGGKQGAAAFLIQYFSFYMNQRFRVIGTEISFGRGREVFLGTFLYFAEINDGGEWYRFIPITVRVYLTGRIDLLVDNTYKIGPVDHKTTARFDGYEANDFDPHEGITGYIYTINEILKLRFPENPHKICRDGWIFHISSNISDSPRFKPTLITKTPQQLEEFRLRQLSTAQAMLDVVIGERQPYWNTFICNNIYNKPCQFRELHRQPPMQREATLKQFYEIREAWNPERPPQDKKKAKPENLQEVKS